MKKIRTRIFSAAVALTMLASLTVSVNAAPETLYYKDFGVSRTEGVTIEVGDYATDNANRDYYAYIPSAITASIGLDANNNKYLSMTGTFTGSNQTILRQTTSFNPMYTAGNYGLTEMNFKVSPEWGAIRLYHRFDGKQENDVRVSIPVDENLTGISNDTAWVNAKVVYGEEEYVVYVNGNVAASGTTSVSEADRVTDTNGSGEFFEISSPVGNKEGTVLVKDISFMQVPASDIMGINIVGEENIRIPNDNESEPVTAEYTASAVDYMNKEIQGTVNWSLADTYTGVSIDNSGVLTVDNTAQSQVIEIIAEVNGEINSYSVSLIKESISELILSGDTQIQLKNKYETGTITRQYTATAYDFTGEEVIAPVEFSLNNAPEGVTINAEGILTVSDNTEPCTFDVVAVSGNKSAELSVSVVEANNIEFSGETVLIEKTFDNVEVGEKEHGTSVDGFLLWDNTSSKGAGFAVVNKAEGDNYLTMTYPAEKLDKEHYIQCQSQSGTIDSDIFVASVMIKYNTLGNDNIRMEIYDKSLSDSTKISLDTNAKNAANLNYKYNVGEWQELKVVFDRSTHTYHAYMNNYLIKEDSVPDSFWTEGIGRVRLHHKGMPDDGAEHTVCIDNYKVYIPNGPAVQSIYATGDDDGTIRNILNIPTGFSSWGVGQSPSLAGEELTVHMGYTNVSENEVKVRAIAAIYDGGKLVSLSEYNDYTLSPNSLSDKELTITVPESEDLSNYTMKVFSLYDESTPFDNAYTMDNVNWNFSE